MSAENWRENFSLYLYITKIVSKLLLLIDQLAYELKTFAECSKVE